MVRMDFHTADLCDAQDEGVRVLVPMLRSFGQRPAFCGPVSTLRCFEDNSLVRAAVDEPGAGRVLVIDGGASLRCALVGDRLARRAADNGWAGIVVNGCVRDSRVLAHTPIGVLALATHPMRSVKKGAGERDVQVSFAGVAFAPGDFLYADEDGVIVSDHALVQPS